MATYRLRRFTSVEALKSIAPRRLHAFLSRYQTFLHERDFLLPPVEQVDTLDYAGLLRLFATPDARTPAELIEALHLMDEIATPEGMDALLAAAERHALKLDPGGEHTPIDVAVQVWLQEPRLLERKHAEQLLLRPRSFVSFRIRQRPLPPTPTLHHGHLAYLEQLCDEEFGRRHRGQGTRVTSFVRDHGLWFLIRHGDPYRREEALDGSQTRPLSFRPPKYDVVVYDAQQGELRVNARSRWEQDLYRRAFNLVLFRAHDVFGHRGKYTLEPLLSQGTACLVCSDIPGLDWIVLKELQLFWGGRQRTSEIYKALDVFAALQERRRTLPPHASLTRAVFQVKFRGTKTPRSLTIRPAHCVQFTRDADAELLEDWMQRRGFIKALPPAEDQNHDLPEPLVVDP